MRRNRLALLTTAMFTTLVAVACSSGGGSHLFHLDSGNYHLVPSAVPNDSCFGDSVSGFIVGTALPFQIVSTPPAFTLAPEPGTTIGEIMKEFLPPLAGTRTTGEGLSLTAVGHYFLTSSCSLGFSAAPPATGLMTANDEFDLDLPLHITATTTNQAYTAFCSTAAQAKFSALTDGFVPWPALDGANQTTGSCGITIDAHVAPQ